MRPRLAVRLQHFDDALGFALDGGLSSGHSAVMYTAITHDIRVTVRPEYLAARSEPEAGRFLWAYTIEIANLGTETVQLLARHWHITDANGHHEDVRGPGVIGEQPTLKPGESFRYTSGCPLTTPSGIMVGTYAMRSAKGATFDIAIPAFSLDSPESRRVLN